MRASQHLADLVEDLQREVAVVRGTRQTSQWGDWVDAGRLQGLVAGCRLLIHNLGRFGSVWDNMLEPPPNNETRNLEKISGVLDSIGNALAKGRLATLDELISTEVLSDLLEHAEELLTAKFNLAAAVILRSVLEERLRKLSSSHNCAPTVPRPTIETYKQSLYAAKVIDKIVVKDIDWMAGVGNAAAHRLPEYKDEDVPQLYQRVAAFLMRFSPT